MPSVLGWLRDIDQKVTGLDFGGIQSTLNRILAAVDQTPVETKLDTIIGQLGQIIELIGPQPTATHAVLTLNQGANPMPGAINVDTTNETVSISFVDDKGDTDATAPDGAVIAYTSDNEAVATVDPTSGAITPVAEGTANIGATLTAADGSPLLEADGSTPFPAPATVPVTVSAGAAVGGALTLSV